ncbi:hypothetical protein GCM10027447_31820 [Glycomyces halotolerans]
MSLGSVKDTLKMLAAAACGAVMALSFASAASAHAALVSTDPEDGAALDTAPESFSATFSEILDGPSTEIAVTGPGGEAVEVDEPSFDGDTFTQPMRYTAPGRYTVAFRVISEDGHRVDGSVAFTVEEIPAELYAEGFGGTEEPTEETTAGAEPTETAAEEEPNTGAALATILLAFLVIVLGGVLLVKLLGRNRSDATDS